MLSFPSFSQEIERIEELMQDDFTTYDSLPFKHLYQKALLYNGVLHTTVLNQNNNTQFYVAYQYNGSVWKITEMGIPGTFYAGNNLVGRILAGGTANIKAVPDLANERDFVQMPDSSAWFTSDKSGTFQLYELKNKQAVKVDIAGIANKHLINLWNYEQSLFFDVYNPETNNAVSHWYSNGQLQALPYDLMSVSFNDSLLVYIKKGQLYINYKQIDRSLCSFTFAFTDTTYSQGISFTTEETLQLSIDSSSIIDGVLTENTKERIGKMLAESANLLSEIRTTEILDKIRNSNDLVSFSFSFLDSTYTNALQLSKQEQEQLGIDTEMVNDGVFNEQGKAKISQMLQSDSLQIDKERRNLINNKIDGIIKFYGFFADTFTYITSKYPVEKIASNGIISVEGLETYLTGQEKGNRYTKLLSILATRAWVENKQLNNTDTVIIQVGCYSKKLTDFVEHVKSIEKIDEKNSVFLKSLNIYCISAGGYYYYRTKTSVCDLLLLKKAIYFDKPFIIKNNI
ncbi:MAG TPA: hypothetical protein DCQ31_18415 [Bacteroidales bacterium]|nr:hypothetical protein [Bacteroidales bacterium]